MRKLGILVNAEGEILELNLCLDSVNAFRLQLPEWLRESLAKWALEIREQNNLDRRAGCSRPRGIWNQTPEAQKGRTKHKKSPGRPIELVGQGLAAIMSRTIKKTHRAAFRLAAVYVSLCLV